MAYLTVYKNWLPYALLEDKRGFISKRFGNGHSGIDSVGNVYNNTVCAVMDGMVTAVYFSPTLGNCVEYGCGNVKIAHYHLAETSVQTGDKVEKGKSILGVEGRTGSLAKGKHLHTTVWIGGVTVDPEPYLSGRKNLEDILSDENADDEITEVREVIRSDLNLRDGAGVSNKSYGKIPKGSLLCVTSKIDLGTAVWGKTAVKMSDGKVYVGYSNLGEKWSRKYTGAIEKVKTDGS